jgi:hypothetical protein
MAGGPGDDQRDGEADYEHVDCELAEECAGGEFAFGSAGERDDDERHEQVEKRAVEDAADDGVREENWESAAGCVVDGGCCEGDCEVKQEAQGGASSSGLEAGIAECSAGDELEQAFKRAAFGREERGGAREIKDAADRTCERDYCDGWHLCAPLRAIKG